MISPFLLLLAMASVPDNQPLLPPPPKPEPDPEPEPGSKIRLSDASGREVILDGVEWQIGVDHAAGAPERPHVMHLAQMQALRDESRRILLRAGNSVGKTCVGHSFDEPPDEHYMQAVRQRSRGLTPWAPLRRVADPEKKRARKAQKKARRAGR